MYRGIFFNGNFTVLIIGAGGMLGYDLVSVLKKDCPVNYKYINDFDITRKDWCINTITSLKPEIVINSAAFTHVDLCEKEKDRAFLVNAYGVENLAVACKESDAFLISFSTDYIFNGCKKEPYKEEDIPSPLNQYGLSKLKGERLIKDVFENYLIIRTSWLYGNNGPNFVDSVLEQAKAKKVLNIVNDQKGSPTYTRHLSKAVKLLLGSNARGILHITNTGSCTWYDFALKILEFSGIKDVEVNPVTSKELGRPAIRPEDSRLDNNMFYRLTGCNMPDWEKGLTEYLKNN
ncbi:MAG: dTDP-4-dehydrorhamnose reductase [Thermodesulfobacteriota bacterium]|nr:dTDP-4-dehydrorhamnose reductase [Thermodesulfobacteriota bacterium]